MTTYFTFRGKWKLWITFLAFSLAFVILISAPLKTSAFTESFDTLNLGDITGQNEWQSSCYPGTSTAGQVVNSYASSSPNSLLMSSASCGQSYQEIYHSLSATTTDENTAEFDIYMNFRNRLNQGILQFGSANSGTQYLAVGCAATPPVDGYTDCGFFFGGVANPPTYQGLLQWQTWNHAKWTFNPSSGITKIETWSDTYHIATTTMATSTAPADFSLWILNNASWGYIDNLVLNEGVEPPPPPTSSLTITAPTSGSTASSTFPLNFTYNLQSENSNKLLVIFEAWSASSTCPVYGDSNWQSEYDAGWFYNQSLPYFSPRLTATSTEATSTIAVYNLDQPFFYNCVHCYFYNSDTATSTFAEKCPDYLLNVSGYVSPGQPLPIGSWPSYYASHTDDKFPTSTAIFTTITGVFSDIVQKITSFVNDFRTIFDSESAYAKGAELGSAIPTARGYLKPINDFFGSLPVSEIFIFCILTLLVVNVYRLVKTILQLIRG